jgi:hypothetical protein
MTNLNNLYVDWIPTMWAGGWIPTTAGKYIFVDYTLGSDGNNGLSIQEPVKTIAQANTLLTTNKDDVIVLLGSATHVLTAMLDMSKNRVHMVWLDWSWGRYYGQNAKVSLWVTTAATDIWTIKTTWVRNSFTNIKFINDNTVAQWIYCFVDWWEYTTLKNCEIYKSTDMDETWAAELVANGDSSQYLGCTIWSLATARSWAVIRPTVLFTKWLAWTWKVARDNLFQDCRFWINASDTANRFVYWANATDIERIAEFNRCWFINNGASANVPAQNVAFGATLTVWDVLLNNCYSVNANTAMSTTTWVFINCWYKFSIWTCVF